VKFEPGVLPKKPYRDSALMYAGFAVVFIIIVFATNGRLVVGIPVAVACFLIATGYSWWKIRQRLEAEAQEAEKEES
jgi:ABC-type bacteriocin/lantibiotic exporter with double-glycine peptidase domain